MTRKTVYLIWSMILTSLARKVLVCTVSFIFCYTGFNSYQCLRHSLVYWVCYQNLFFEWITENSLIIISTEFLFSNWNIGICNPTEREYITFHQTMCEILTNSKILCQHLNTVVVWHASIDSWKIFFYVFIFTMVFCKMCNIGISCTKT